MVQVVELRGFFEVLQLQEQQEGQKLIIMDGPQQVEAQHLEQLQTDYKMQIIFHRTMK
jgi:hypothetical protein